LDSVAVCHIYKNFPSYDLIPWICSTIMHWNRLKKGKIGVLYEKRERGKGRGEQAHIFFPTFRKLSPLMDRDTKIFDIPAI
jgi:hypothetical protein